MSQGALKCGIAGGIIGTITAAVGIIWSILSTILMVAIYWYTNILSVLTQSFGFLGLLYSTTPPSQFLFLTFSIILAALLIVSGILVGIGFYGLRSAGAGAMSYIGLTMGIGGSIVGASLILLGSIIQKGALQLIRSFVYPYMISIYVPLVVYSPEYLLIWIGMLFVAVTFLLLGLASVFARDATARPELFLAAGILSVICACFLFAYTYIGIYNLINVSFWYNPFGGGVPYALEMVGGPLASIGFVPLFIAGILWAIVFNSTK